MTPDQQRHQKLKDLFNRASNLPPGKMSEFLERECAGDAELRAEVENLLKSDQDYDKTLDPIPSTRPKQIGPYTIRETLGQGGFGTVYLAERLTPIHMKVALKVISEGRDRKEVVARFDAERQAMALLNHPHIAQIYDAGSTDDGRPYFVMEYVPGVPITDYCDRHRLGTRERLVLFAQVCEAIQHAHSRNIVHRDLKPGNVLVYLQDDVPTPKIIDFGVAKGLNVKLTDMTLHTLHGVPVGTLAYMSPEQAESSPLGIDAGSDIYSLGVMLYELLVGVMPFELKRAALDEMLRVIREDDPEKPSTRIQKLGPKSTGVAEKRHTEPGHLVKEIRGGLDWVTMMAMRKERKERYKTAAEFAEDIRRFLRDEPVIARPPSFSYLWFRRIRRNKTKCAVGFAFAVLVTVSALAIQWLRIEGRAQAHLDKGILYLDNHQVVDAEKEFRQALQLAPGNPKLLERLAADLQDNYFLQPNGQRDPALLRESFNFIEQALRTRSGEKEKARPLNAGALNLALRGDLAQAEKWSRDAVAADPSAYWAQSFLAKILAIKGQMDEALSAAEFGARIAPAQGDLLTYTDGVWLCLATLQMHKSNWDNAKKSFDEARRIDPKDPRNKIMSARFYLSAPEREGNAENALDLIKSARDAKFPYRTLNRILAIAFLETDKLEEAVNHATLAIEKTDKPSFNHLIAAIANAKLGKIDAAEASFSRATQAWPPPEFMDPTSSMGLDVVADIDSYEMLWIDTLTELESLKKQAEEAIQTAISNRR